MRLARSDTRKAITQIAACLLILWPVVISLNLQKVDAAIGLTVTNGPTTNSSGWTNSNNANGVTDDNSYATASPARNATISGDWSTFGFDSSLPSDVTITKVEVIPQYKVSVTNSIASLNVQAVVAGTTCPTTAANDPSEPTTDTEFVADITSCRTWTRTNLLNANFSVRIGAVRANSPTAVTFSLDYIKVRITYNTPTYDQFAYRFYENADSTTPGSPWAAQNTAITLYAPSDKFRLRYLLRVADVNLSSNGEQFKLQFGQKISTCAAATYSDVSAATAISFYNNPTPADNTTISSGANDPTDSPRTINMQKYAESNPINTANAVNTGQDGIWDISLYSNSAPANTTYCLRIIKSGGGTLDTYTSYPEITTSPSASLDVDFVNSSGLSVSSPSFGMTSLTSGFSCQTPTATLSTSSQKIRVRNTTTSPAWSLSIAATSGSTALWSAGTPKYDFNDPSGSPAGCSAGLDSDAYAGQMAIDASSGTLTPRSVCSNIGVTKGSSAAYSEGVTDSITLLSASASAQTGCYWELTGVSVSQKVPNGQAIGNYTINLTMTVVAN